MEEVRIKTHLIITDIHNEYHIDWCGKIANTNPKFKNGKPVFIIVGSKGNGRMEVNTTSMKEVEKCAKLMTNPRGRGSVTTDICRIFIKEENGKETLMGILTQNNIKSYAPMYDKVGFER